MPRQLFDGFGNVVTAYSAEEFAAVVAQNENLKRKVAGLEKQVKRKSRRKVAEKTVRPA